MKKKRLEKKLVLNKKTLTNLDFSGMAGVHGGVETDPTFQTDDRWCALYSCDHCTWSGYPQCPYC